MTPPATETLTADLEFGDPLWGAVVERRASVRARLDEAIGPELAERLVKALTRPHSQSARLSM